MASEASKLPSSLLDSTDSEEDDHATNHGVQSPRKRSPPSEEKNEDNSSSFSLTVGNVLFGRANFYIYTHLPKILSTRPFQHRRKKQATGGKPSVWKDGVTPIRFLYDMAAQLGLPKTGKKAEFVTRIVNYYFDKTDEFEKDFAGLYDDVLFKKELEADLKTETEFDALLRKDHEGPVTAARSRAIRVFGPYMLSNAFEAKRLGLYPSPTKKKKHINDAVTEQDNDNDEDSTTSRNGDNDSQSRSSASSTEDIIFFDDHEIRSSFLLESLSEVDTTLWETEGSVSAHGQCRRKSPTCALRLFLIILADDVFFRRLLSESKATLNREQIDSNARGDRSDFWVDVTNAFKDDGFKVPPVPVDHPFFIDKHTGAKYDVSKCNSPWVTPRHIRRWYTDAHNTLSRYKARCDTSGKHDFCLEHLSYFFKEFPISSRDACFLAGIALWRGDDALEWFDGKIALPEALLVDGLLANPAADNVSFKDVHDEEDDVSTIGGSPRGGGDRENLKQILADAMKDNRQHMDKMRSRTGHSKHQDDYFAARAAESRERAAESRERAAESRERKRILAEQASIAACDKRKRKLDEATDLLERSKVLTEPQLAARMERKAMALFDAILDKPTDTDSDDDDTKIPARSTT